MPADAQTRLNAMLDFCVKVLFWCSLWAFCCSAGALAFIVFQGPTALALIICPAMLLVGVLTSWARSRFARQRALEPAA